jgi:hypothetical protein
MKTLGSRAEVWHEKALKTTGGLMKKDLVQNKYGYIVSKKKSQSMKKKNNNPLKPYLQPKDSQTFGPFNIKNNKEENKNPSLINVLSNLFV